MEQFVLAVGKYTDIQDDGIVILGNPEGNILELAPLCSIIEGVNPSYLAWDSSTNLLFAVGELESQDKRSGGELHCWHWEKGEAEYKGQIAVKGAAPCSIDLIPESQLVITSNYSSGNVTIASYSRDGLLTGPIAMIERTGSGLNKSRQESSHPHCIKVHPDGRGFYLSDLGTDEIVSYRFKYTGSWFQLKGADPHMCPPGSGPRHFRIHPAGRYAFVITELANTLRVYCLDKGRLQFHQEVSLLPADYKGESYGSEVCFSNDGRFVYCANRIHDSIVRYSFDCDTGKLSDPRWVSCEGKFPRHIAISPTGRHLISANQHSDTVTVFELDFETGIPAYTGVSYEVTTPSFILFLPRY